MRFFACVSLFYFCLLVHVSEPLFGQIAPIDSPYYGLGMFDVVTDLVNDRSPKLRIHRPVSNDDGPFPLILFEQGANGFFQNFIDNTSYDSTMRHLASYGYVVVVMSEGFPYPFNNDFADTLAWIRTQVDQDFDWWGGAIDFSKIVVGGHSLGGTIASQMLRGKEQRVAGVVYFGAYPLAPIFQQVDEFQGFVLSLSGEEDTQAVTKNTRQGYESFVKSSCRSWINIQGMGHGGFGDYQNDGQPVGSIGREFAVATLRHYLVSFLQARLRDDAGADVNFFDRRRQPSTTLQMINQCGNQAVADDVKLIEQQQYVYPNPAQDVIHVQYGKERFNVHIKDAYGRIRRVYHGVRSGRPIEVGGLPSGWYELGLISPSGHRTMRCLLN